MSLPTYPPTIPTSPYLKALDRGQQNYILTNQGASQSFSGTTLPTGSVAYAIPPGVANEQGPPTVTFQLDAYGAPAAVVHALASLDGVNFYDMGALQASGTYGIFSIVDKKARYWSAYVSAYAGSGGTTDSITVSIFA